jgi:arginase family enzyme
LDIDVLDPVYAPGTGTPVSFGINPSDLLLFLQEACTHAHIVGIDLVEVNSLLDINQQTVRLATDILVRVMGWSVK